MQGDNIRQSLWTYIWTCLYRWWEIYHCTSKRISRSGKIIYFICSSSSDGRSAIKLSKIKIRMRKNTKKDLMNDNDVCICFLGVTSCCNFRRMINRCLIILVHCNLTLGMRKYVIVTIGFSNIVFHFLSF